MPAFAAPDPTLVGDWDFVSTSSGDSTGNWGAFELQGSATVTNGQLVVDGTGNGSNAASAWARARTYTGPAITNKTMMAWVALDSTSITSGAPIGLYKPSGDQFDSIVYAERQALRWMAGSNSFSRTADFSPGADDAAVGSMRQIAISYSDNGDGTQTIRGCLNGVSLGSYSTSKIGFTSSDGPVAVFGPRHLAGGEFGNPTGSIKAHIDEARLYNRAIPCAAVADADLDHLLAESDNCPTVANAGQADTDGDGVGDACDSTPTLVVHRFKFDGSMDDLRGGTAAAVVSGSASYASGAFDQALSLNGSTQVSLGDALTTGDAAGAGDFTISGTFKTTQATPSMGAVLVGNRQSCSSGGWLHVVLFDGHLAVESVASGSGYTNLNAPSTVNDGAFHRFALMRSGTSLTLWQDGVQVAAGSSSGDVRNSTGLQTGSIPPGCTGLQYNGLLDDVRVENGANPLASQRSLTSTFPANGNLLDTTGGENVAWSASAYTADRNGTANSAFSFNAISSIIGPAGLDAFGSNDWTISTWIQQSASNTWRGIVSTRTSCDNGGSGFDIRLINGVPWIETRIGSAYRLTTTGSTRIDDGTWHRLTAIRTATQVSLAIDGVVAGSTAVSGAYSTGTTLEVGGGVCLSHDATQRFIGALDDLTITNGIAAPVVTTAADVSGTQQAGQTLTASAAFGGTSPAVTYAWKRCDNAGSNCNTVLGVSSTYTLTAADVGSVIQTTVTGTNGLDSVSTAKKTSAIAPAAPTFSASPSATDPRTSAPFSFSSTTAGVTYECSLDAAAYAACTSPATVAVANGAHTYAVRAVRNGAASTSATFSWTTDTSAPVTLTVPGSASGLDSGISVTAGQPLKISATGTWNCNNLGCSSTADGVGFGSGSLDPSTSIVGLIGRIGTSGRWFDIGSGPTRVQGSGELYLAMNETDWSDNSGSLSVTIAPTSSSIAITAGPVPTAGSLATTGTTARFAFSGNGPSYECSYDLGTTWSACSSPVVHTYAAGTGKGQFRVRSTGAAGVMAIAPLWTVSSGAGPATPSISSTDYTRFTSAPTFTFSATGATAYECSVDGGSYSDCSSGSKTVSGASAGSHTLAVRAYDANGSATSASRTFVIATAATMAPQIVTSSMTADTAYNANTTPTTGGTDLRGGSFDASGNLYVPALEQYQLHKYGSSGAPAASFPMSVGSGPGPMDVEVDKDGNVWVLRWSGPSVLDKRSSSGTVLASYTLTGTGNMQSIGADPVTGILYMTNGSSVYRFDPQASSPTATQIATGFSAAWDVAVGGDGTIYVAEKDANRVTKLSPTGANLGTFTTTSGPRHSQLVGGVLYVATEANTVDAYGVDGTKLLSLPQAVHGNSTGLWWGGADSAGRIYAAGYNKLSRATVSTLAYTEDDPATAVDPQMSVTDAGVPNILTANLQISGFHSGEDVIAYTLPSGISVAGGTDPSIGMWNFSGSASVATWQTFLRSITFRNTSNTPNTGGRGVYLAIGDTAGQISNVYQRTITVTATNDAPAAGGDRPAIDPTTSATAHLTPGTAKAVRIAPTLSDPEGTPIAVRITSIPTGVTVTRTAGGTTVNAGDTVALSGGNLNLTVTAPTTTDVTLGYRVVDPADSSLLSPASTMTIDVVPDLSIDSGPADGSSTTDRTATFTFSGAGSGSHYTCQVDGGTTDDPCTSPLALTGLGVGSHTLALTAVDAEGDTTLRTVGWTVTNAAPSAGGNRTAAGSAVPGTAFTAEITPMLSDDAGTPTVARITSIPTGVTVTRTDDSDVAAGDDVTLTAGKLRVKVTAPDTTDVVLDYKIVDSADTSLLSTVSTMTIDVVPGLSIDSGPADGSSTVSRTADFTFSSTGGGRGGPTDTYSCTLDSDPAIDPCLSPQSFSGLAVGAHTFAVTATDLEGDTATKGVGWTITNAAPSAGGDRTAAGSAVPGSAFSAEISPTIADDAGTPTTARIVSIPSTATLTQSGGTPIAVGDDVPLVGGKLQLKVTPSTPADLAIGYKIVDPADSTLLSSTSIMTIDVVPAASIDSGPVAGSTTTDKTATFTFSGAGTGGSYECKLDGGAFAACTSPRQVTGLDAGGRTFTVRVIDAEGDTATVSRSWTVANDAPSAGGDKTAGPAVPGTALAVEVSPTLADPQGVLPTKARIVSFPQSVTLARTDGTPIAAGDDVTLSQGKLRFTLTASTPADATVTYRLVDAADATLLSPASAIAVDVRPVLSIDGGPANGSSSGDANPTFTFSGAGADGGYTCSADNATTGVCSSPTRLPNLRWGSHTFSVRATDVDGDTDSRTITWTVTGSLNAPTILSGPPAETGDRTATIAFQGDPGSVPQCSLDGSTFTWCADSATFSNLPLGPHTFSVRQVDAAGNVSPVTTRRWRIDVKFTAADEGQNIKTVKAKVNDEVAPQENLVGVGCELNRGSLRQCDVDAFADVNFDSGRKARKASVQKIGTGTVTLAERGQTSAVVNVKLNAVGKRLMAEHPEGVPVTMKVTAQPFDVDTQLVSTTKSTMHPPEMLIVPSRGMFAGDSTDIGKAGLAYVKAVAKLLDGVKRVRCEGYSDSSASSKRAKAIGYLRAKAVCDALKDAGVGGEIGAVGVGSDRPRGDNTTAAGRRRNRRVEIRVWF